MEKMDSKEINFQGSSRPFPSLPPWGEGESGACFMFEGFFRVFMGVERGSRIGGNFQDRVLPLPLLGGMGEESLKVPIEYNHPLKKSPILFPPLGDV